MTRATSINDNLINKRGTFDDSQVSTTEADILVGQKITRFLYTRTCINKHNVLQLSSKFAFIIFNENGNQQHLKSMHDFSSKTLSSNMTTRRIRLLVEKNGQVRHLVDFIFNRSTTPGRKKKRPSVRLCFFRNKYQFFLPGIGHYKNPIGLLD